jgi:hypothetical protein
MKVKKQRKIIKQFFAAVLLSIQSDLTFWQRFKYVYLGKVSDSLIKIINQKASINYEDVLNNYKSNKIKAVEPQRSN